MKLDHHILAVVEPEIRPLQIKKNAVGEPEGGDRQTKALANLEPLIKIGAYEFKAVDIAYFRLTLSGKVPYMEATIVDNNNLFDTEFYPRDGDAATVFMNSKNNDTFKSIHMDFDLLNVEMPRETPVHHPTIRISGYAKIPNYNAEVCKHYDDGSSLDHLELIARELKLGLATNIQETDDKQARIQPWTDYATFIEEVVDTCFVSPKSFTTWYIDQFYYLNFVDINKIFDSPNPPPGELQKNYAAMKASLAESATEPENKDNLETPLMLSNETNLRPTNMYIAEYKVQNNAASISRSEGYARTITFYDDNGEDGKRLVEREIKPFQSESMPESDMALRGSMAEKFERTKTETKNKWIGRQNAGNDGLGNVHANALYSILIDHQNYAELQKMKLIVKLDSFNPSLYKFMKIPVMIYDIDPTTTRTRAELKEAAKEAGAANESLAGKNETSVTSAENPNSVQNHFLSGYYVIENIDYVYSSDNLKMIQELTLIRREWPGKAVDLGSANKS